jgi:hypothetical protein
MTIDVLPGRGGTGDSLCQNALDPGFHGVPPVPHARTVMLMVPVGPDSGFPNVPLGLRPLAERH